MGCDYSLMLNLSDGLAYSLTHGEQEKMSAISHMTFSDDFLWIEILYSDYIFTEVCSWGWRWIKFDVDEWTDTCGLTTRYVIVDISLHWFE